MTKQYYNVYLKGKRSITEVLIKATSPEQAKSIYCKNEGLNKAVIVKKVPTLVTK
jgi:hypothetical protein